MHEQLAYCALDNIFLNVFAQEWGSGFVTTVLHCVSALTVIHSYLHAVHFPMQIILH